MPHPHSTTGEQAPIHAELQDFLTHHRHALVELPRDHGKSTQVCTRIIWELGNDPGLRVTVVCSTEAIARQRSRYLRNQIQKSKVVQAVFPELLPEKPWTAHTFTVRRLAEFIGASVSAVGIDGGSTGTRADLLVCDDVVDVRSVYSKAERDRAAVAFHDNLMNLLEPGGRCWCLFTPWHRDDLNARLKRNPSFAHFRRAIGPELESIWPGKWPADALAARRAEIGEAPFARGYRLLPVAEDDSAIKPEWVRTWAECPGSFDSIVLAVDPAVTAKPGADASGLVVLGRAEKTVYCLEAVARRIRTPELLTLIDDVDRRWNPTVIAVESNGPLKGIVDLFRQHARFGSRVQPVTNSKAKALRVMALGVRCESGCFKLKAGPGGGVDPGQQGLWDEMIAFPFGSSDDLVDAAAFGTEAALMQFEPRIWVL